MKEIHPKMVDVKMNIDDDSGNNKAMVDNTAEV